MVVGVIFGRGGVFCGGGGLVCVVGVVVNFGLVGLECFFGFVGGGLGELGGGVDDEFFECGGSCVVEDFGGLVEEGVLGLGVGRVVCGDAVVERGGGEGLCGGVDVVGELVRSVLLDVVAGVGVVGEVYCPGLCLGLG